MKMKELDDLILSVLTNEWMTLTLIQTLVNKISPHANDDLISLWCGMLIGEDKVDSMKILTKNSEFYAIRKKQKVEKGDM